MCPIYSKWLLYFRVKLFARRQLGYLVHVQKALPHLIVKKKMNFRMDETALPLLQLESFMTVADLDGKKCTLSLEWHHSKQRWLPLPHVIFPLNGCSCAIKLLSALLHHNLIRKQVHVSFPFSSCFLEQAQAVSVVRALSLVVFALLRCCLYLCASCNLYSTGEQCYVIKPFSRLPRSFPVCYGASSLPAGSPSQSYPT